MDQHDEDCGCDGDPCKQSSDMSSLYERRTSQPRAIKIDSKASIDCYFSSGFEADDEVFIEFEEWQSSSTSSSFTRRHMMSEGNMLNINRRQRRTSDVIDSVGNLSLEDLSTGTRRCTSPDLRETIHHFNSRSPLTPRSDIGYWSSSVTSVSSPLEPKWFRYSQSSETKALSRKGSVRSDTGHPRHSDGDDAGTSIASCPKNYDYMASRNQGAHEQRLRRSTTGDGEENSITVRHADIADASVLPGTSEHMSDDSLPRYELKETFAPVEKDSYEYNMNHKKRGIAVIFNHEEYRTLHLPRRDGSKHDVVALSKLYTLLGFEVRVYKDLLCRELYDVLHNLAKEDHTNHDCLIITVLTHGLEGGSIYAFDSPYPCEDLYTGFEAGNCLTLAGKPKIFIIQACRGKILDPGVTLISRTATDSATTTSYTIPSMSDFLIANSTYGGHYSWRNPDEGTWYIQSFVNIVSQHYKDVDLLTMMTRVAWSVAILYESYNAEKPDQPGIKQSPSLMSTLIRQIYFRPKEGGG